MRVRMLLGGALALSLVAVQPASAQPVRGGRGGAMFQSPVAFLLEQGDTLKLTAEQQTRLTALNDSLDVLNAPNIKKMEEARASGGGGGGMQALRPVMQALRENNDTFQEKALALLHESQRTLAQKLLDARQRRRRGGGPVL